MRHPFTPTHLAAAICASLSFGAHAHDDDIDADAAALLTAPYDAHAPAAFIDDFSSRSTLDLILHNWGDGAPGMYWEDDHVVLEAATAGEDTEADTQLMLQDDTDFVSVTVALSSDTVMQTSNDARARVRIKATWVSDQQNTADDRTGDLEMQIGVAQSGNGARWVDLWVARRNSDGDNEDIELWEIPGFDALYDFVPQLDTDYTLSIRRDPERNVAIFGIDDLTAELPLGDAVFKAKQARTEISVKADQGPAKTIAHVHSIETDNYSYDFSTVPLTAPYRPSWDLQYGHNSAEINGGMLTLTSNDDPSGRRATIATERHADYMAVDIGVSSETEITNSESFQIGLVNNLGNLQADGFEDSDDVFGLINIESSGPGLYTALYCVWHDSPVGWLELVSNTGNCENAFNTPIEEDVLYPASVEIDRDNANIVFNFNGETVEHALPAIYAQDTPYARIGARPDENGVAVGVFDNLQFGKAALPLSQSPDRLLIDPASDIPAADDTTDTSDSGGGGGMGLVLGLLAGLAARRRLGQESKG